MINFISLIPPKIPDLFEQTGIELPDKCSIALLHRGKDRGRIDKLAEVINDGLDIDYFALFSQYPTEAIQEHERYLYSYLRHRIVREEVPTFMHLMINPHKPMPVHDHAISTAVEVQCIHDMVIQNYLARGKENFDVHIYHITTDCQLLDIDHGIRASRLNGYRVSNDIISSGVALRDSQSRRFTKEILRKFLFLQGRVLVPDYLNSMRLRKGHSPERIRW